MSLGWGSRGSPRTGPEAEPLAGHARSTARRPPLGPRGAKDALPPALSRGAALPGGGAASPERMLADTPTSRIRLEVIC
jgi:hypothetical protein